MLTLDSINFKYLFLVYCFYLYCNSFKRDSLSCFRVTKEHRESLSKNAKGLFTKCKDSIRDVQNKFVKTVKIKEKEGLSKDMAFEVSESVRV